MQQEQGQLFTTPLSYIYHPQDQFLTTTMGGEDFQFQRTVGEQYQSDQKQPLSFEVIFTGSGIMDHDALKNYIFLDIFERRLFSMRPRK